MKARALLSAVLAAAVLALPARADTTSVQILDTGYEPGRAVVLTGDTVGWRNSSFVNQHTVTAAGFDSGPIVPGGGFFHEFPVPGAYRYACTIHPFLSGVVDVFGLLMSGPERAVARGAATTLRGKAAGGIGSVTVEEDTGAGFHAVTTTEASDGAFKATVHPPANATYRAVGGAECQPADPGPGVRPHGDRLEGVPTPIASARRSRQSRCERVAPAQAPRALRVVDGRAGASRQALGRTVPEPSAQARLGASRAHAERRLDDPRGERGSPPPPKFLVALPKTSHRKRRSPEPPCCVLGRPRTHQYAGSLRPCLAAPEPRRLPANVPRRTTMA